MLGHTTSRNPHLKGQPPQAHPAPPPRSARSQKGPVRAFEDSYLQQCRNQPACNGKSGGGAGTLMGHWSGKWFVLALLLKNSPARRGVRCKHCLQEVRAPTASGRRLSALPSSLSGARISLEAHWQNDFPCDCLAHAPPLGSIVTRFPLWLSGICIFLVTHRRTRFSCSLQGTEQSNTWPLPKIVVQQLSPPNPYHWKRTQTCPPLPGTQQQQTFARSHFCLVLLLCSYACAVLISVCISITI